MWNRLEELEVPLSWELPRSCYTKNIIAKFKNNEGWTTDINCNIGVKQGFPLTPTLFGIYIDKLKKCLEEVGCGTILDGIVIILLLYADDIIFMERCPYDLNKQLIILKDFL